MSDITTASSSDKPLRKDAERNRRRILDAARELFAQRGLEATLNDVAHHAGVGVGTVYRRFPDKSELIDSLFEEDFEEMVGRAEQALADPDPWNGIVGFLTGTAEAQFADKGLQDLLTETPEGMARIARVRRRLLPLVTELIARAQSAGQLRDDVHASDLAMAQLMVASVIDSAREVAPELWRRYLELILRGMAGPGEELRLGTPPLEPEQLDRVLSRYKSTRR